MAAVAAVTAVAAAITAMKLLTHNLLQCHIKGVKNGYPLKIEATKVESRDADYDPGRIFAQRRRHDACVVCSQTIMACCHAEHCPHADFLRSMFGRLNWAAFLEGARAVRRTGSRPAPPSQYLLPSAQYQHISLLCNPSLSSVVSPRPDLHLAWP